MKEKQFMFKQIVEKKFQSLYDASSIDNMLKYNRYNLLICNSRIIIQSHNCPNLELFVKSHDNIKKLMEELKHSCSAKVFASNLEAIKKELSQQKEYFLDSTNEILKYYEIEIQDKIKLQLLMHDAGNTFQQIGKYSHVQCMISSLKKLDVQKDALLQNCQKKDHVIETSALEERFNEYLENNINILTQWSNDYDNLKTQQKSNNSLVSLLDLLQFRLRKSLKVFIKAQEQYKKESTTDKVQQIIHCIQYIQEEEKTLKQENNDKITDKEAEYFFQENSIIKQANQYYDEVFEVLDKLQQQDDFKGYETVIIKRESQSLTEIDSTMCSSIMIIKKLIMLTSQVLQYLRNAIQSLIEAFQSPSQNMASYLNQSQQQTESTTHQK